MEKRARDVDATGLYRGHIALNAVRRAGSPVRSLSRLLELPEGFRGRSGGYYLVRLETLPEILRLF